LLVRRQGVLSGAVGVVLHGLHHIVALAAAVVALATWIGSGFERTSATPEALDTESALLHP
jgi:hypothetical protein